MVSLFDPITIRDLTIPNRVWMAPMCMYAAQPQPEEAGLAKDFHYAHYMARAAGGAGLIILEATAVMPNGRISPWDLGIWDDRHIPALARIADGIRENGAVPAIQLAHAGRKASDRRPTRVDPAAAEQDEQDYAAYRWQPVGPSALAFPNMLAPHALTKEEIAEVVQAFADGARRADQAGFEVIELHAAHGYLLHQFLSPLANHRDDEYGGSLENRARIVLEVIEAVRAVWPETKPLFMRISMTDWVEEKPDDQRESWTMSQSVQLANWAHARGVDLIDASSGGIDLIGIPKDRDYQTTKAAELKAQTDCLVGAVGRIETPERAQPLIAEGKADVVLLGRPFLREPSWANHAAVALGATPRYLEQYARAV